MHVAATVLCVPCTMRLSCPVRMHVVHVAPCDFDSAMQFGCLLHGWASVLIKFVETIKVACGLLHPEVRPTCP